MTDSITQFLPLCLSNMIDSIPNFHPHIYPTHQKFLMKIYLTFIQHFMLFIQHVMLLYSTFYVALPNIYTTFTQHFMLLYPIIMQHPRYTYPTFTKC